MGVPPCAFERKGTGPGRLAAWRTPSLGSEVLSQPLSHARCYHFARRLGRTCLRVKADTTSTATSRIPSGSARNRGTLTVEDWSAAMAAIAIPIGSLRSYKNALRDHFPPAVKSAHLSEALAAAVGFRTHATLLSAVAADSAPAQLAADDLRFVNRLLELGYEPPPGFSFSELKVDSPISATFRARLTQLRELEASVPKEPIRQRLHYEEMRRLRRKCAAEFAENFGLGTLGSKDDKLVVHQWAKGVDIGAAPAGWGHVVDSHHPGPHFPGTDHAVHFYQRLPLSSGKFVEYCTAMVSMPYVDGVATFRDLEEATRIAEAVGWQINVDAPWSWYAVGSTTLVLFRRTTPHIEVVKAWERSFKRWVLENKSRLKKGAAQGRRNLVDDIIACPHFPLDVRNYEECRERYLKEFVSYLFHGDDDSQAIHFKKLFQKWLEETTSSAELAVG